MYVLVRFEVAEFERWKEAFDDRAAVRAEHGCRGGSVFTRADSDRKVVLLAEWDDTDRAQEYFDSAEFRRAMTDAGVQRKPDVTVLEDAGEIPVELDDSEEDDERDD
ncbi:antibiotic biosynthesis monooxygenase [Halobacteria archaeon AArc-curdl1]|uniref:Antibiotic biosynthesis monooxygenase n=1 Tax=Natronosalvus hydrolyticus TaxID=2979988 RepID=A0AAP3E5V9_9EURY|nr:antibiotic biosynthesis monooxygenase [Halobacteria archaeon AArc-curdl1]